MSAFVSNPFHIHCLSPYARRRSSTCGTGLCAKTKLPGSKISSPHIYSNTATRVKTKMATEWNCVSCATVKEGEIDFVVTEEREPLFAVECKLGQSDLDKNIRYFSSRTNIPQFYQTHLAKKEFQQADFRVHVLPFDKLARKLGLP